MNDSTTVVDDGGQSDAVDAVTRQQVVRVMFDALGIRPSVATTLRATFDIATQSTTASADFGFGSGLLSCRTVRRSRRCAGRHRRVGYPRIDCTRGRRLR